MAAKKNWRDEYREKTANSAKNGNWRDSVSGNGVGSVNATSDWRSAYGDDTASTAAGNIINRVNTWIENHNNYITNYQNRYSGRKYNYEDDYVMDSASWLDTVSKQKSNFDAEADSILSYMDQYQDYLDKDWMKSVRETLTGASGTQAKILESATNDNTFWSKFTPNEEQTAAGYTADKLYKEWQVGQKQYSEDQAYDIEAGLLELEELKKGREAYLAEQAEKRKQAESEETFWDSLGRWLGTTPDTTIPLAGVSGNNGVTNPAEPYDKKIAALEEKIERSKYVQGYEGYMDNMESDDYAAGSKYVSTRTDVAWEDAYWGLGNV